MKKSLSLLCVLAVSTVALSACSSAPSSSSGTTTTRPNKIKTTLAPVIPQSTVTINGTVISVPREEYALKRPIEPFQDDGTHVIISSKGVLPQILNAPKAPVTITWTNLSTKTVTMNFSIFGTPATKQVPAGSSFTYAAKTGGNISYVTSTGYNGTVSVGELPLPPLPAA